MIRESCLEEVTFEWTSELSERMGHGYIRRGTCRVLENQGAAAVIKREGNGGSDQVVEVIIERNGQILDLFLG